MRKKVMLGALATAAALVLAGGIYLTFRGGPPHAPKTVDEAMKVVGSDEFLRLPKDQRQRYLDQARVLAQSMPRDQRAGLRDRLDKDETAQRAFLEGMREFMIKQARVYAAVPVAQRTMMLDMIISQQEKQNARHQARNSAMTPKDKASRTAQQTRMRERFKKFLREGNPQVAGMVTEFIKTLNNRRREKGLPEF